MAIIIVHLGRSTGKNYIYHLPELRTGSCVPRQPVVVPRQLLVVHRQSVVVHRQSVVVPRQKVQMLKFPPQSI